MKSEPKLTKEELLKANSATKHFWANGIKLIPLDVALKIFETHSTSSSEALDLAKKLREMLDGAPFVSKLSKKDVLIIIEALEASAPPAAERTALKARIEESMQIISTNSKRWNDPDDRYIFGVLMDTKDLLDAASASEGTKSADSTDTLADLKAKVEAMHREAEEKRAVANKNGKVSDAFYWNGQAVGLWEILVEIDALTKSRATG